MDLVGLSPLYFFSAWTVVVFRRTVTRSRSLLELKMSNPLLGGNSGVLASKELKVYSLFFLGCQYASYHWWRFLVKRHPLYICLFQNDSLQFDFFLTLLWFAHSIALDKPSLVTLWIMNFLPGRHHMEKILFRQVIEVAITLDRVETNILTQFYLHKKSTQGKKVIHSPNNQQHIVFLEWCGLYL